MLANIINGLDIIFEILGRLSVLIAPFNIRSNMGYVQGINKKRKGIRGYYLILL